MKHRFSGQRELYLEIADRYEQYIRLGVLREGDRLPSVRVAAGEMGVNPNTVQRAYRRLEEQGLLRTILKKGIYVAASSPVSEREFHAPWYHELFALKEKGATYEELILGLKEVYKRD